MAPNQHSAVSLAPNMFGCASGQGGDSVLATPGRGPSRLADPTRPYLAQLGTLSSCLQLGLT